MSRTPIWIIGTMLAATLLAGCRNTEEAAEEVTETVAETGITDGGDMHDTFRSAPPQAYCYECNDGFVFTVHLANRAGVDEATLFMPGRTHTLPLVETSEGDRYWQGDVAFWIENETDAKLEIRGEVFRHCTLDSARTAWVDAKLRGVSYRALGNEPGWILEIDPIHMVWVTGYGETRYVFLTGTPDVDRPARRSTWRTTADGHDFEVVVTGEPCVDDGDISYPTTATITFDGRTYPGCGRALH